MKIADYVLSEYCSLHGERERERERERESGERAFKVLNLQKKPACNSFFKDHICQFKLLEALSPMCIYKRE